MPRRPSPAYYPFADLEPYVRTAWRPDGDYYPHIGINAIAAEVLDVSPSCVNRWRICGLSERTADHVACRLGFHPASIWPDWWNAA